MLDNLPTLAETVKQYGLSADKRLGQHFLLDQNVTDKIAQYAKPLDGVNAVEIGPGPGGLTRSLLRMGAASVLAIEMDERFLPALADIGRESGERLSVYKGNGLKVDIGAELPRPIKIISNLPYNVGTKMLINWLTATPLFWDQMILMFQKEVAQRIVAQVGDSNYGRLAILSQSVAQTQIVYDVPARIFTPPPKVDSAVVLLDPLPKNRRFEDLNTLGLITQSAFMMRRKMLRRSLKPFAKKHSINLENWLELSEIKPENRPEALSVDDFHRLTRHFIHLTQAT
ncbi:MAG: 16S rRNA (adenine(1518)-N(6)/adenine(1519)-N(6))-dimethyltransferase RsmA [Maricaulaceae bacterium]